jgi:hypothetical protein
MMRYDTIPEEVQVKAMESNMHILYIIWYVGSSVLVELMALALNDWQQFQFIY